MFPFKKIRSLFWLLIVSVILGVACADVDDSQEGATDFPAFQTDYENVWDGGAWDLAVWGD